MWGTSREDEGGEGGGKLCAALYRKCLIYVDGNGAFWCILNSVFNLKGPKFFTQRTSQKQLKTCLYETDVQYLHSAS